MGRLAGILGSIALFVFVVLGGWLLLPACGVLGVTLGKCMSETSINSQADITDISRANEALLARINGLEQRIALRQCEPVAALPPQEPPVIDRNSWEQGNNAVLEGCWDLDSRFTTVNRETGQTSRYQTWQICFDRQGRGQERLQADNGNTCNGTVQGGFDGAGALVFEQSANLQCSDGGFIYRIASRCTLNSNGSATCAIRQPEPDTSTTVEFRRAAGGN